MFATLLLVATAAGAPITVAHCEMMHSQSYERGVSVRFHNASNKSVTKVVFHMHTSAHSIDVSDKGEFAPGVTIEHVLATPSWELQHAPQTSCTVKSVTFSDGTAWTAPAHP